MTATSQKRSSLLALALAVALAPLPSRAATLQVPTADHPTIQAAIDAAVDGDVVAVAAGTFLENVQVAAKAIALRGAGRDATTIDGQALGSAIWVKPGATLDLSGVTVTNGTGEPAGGETGFGPVYVGGGLFSDQATVTVTACRFARNGRWTRDYESYGGGLYATSSRLTIVDTDIVENRAWWGGGVAAGSTTLALRNVNVARNVASRAGGIAGGPWGSTAVEGGRLEGNQALVGEGGGAAFGSYGSHRFVDVSISGNSAASHGGGVYTSGYASVSFTRCRVAGNSAVDTGGGAVGWNGGLTLERSVVEGNAAGTGGGVVQYSSSLTLTNSVVRNNTAAAAGGVLVNIGASARIGHATITGNVTTSTADGSGAGGVERQPKPPQYTYSVFTSMVNSIVWGNRRGAEASDVAGFAAGELTFSDVGAGATPGVDGNFSADPALVPGDFHLAAGSPCRDAGTDPGNLWYAGADVDGDPRRLDGGGDGLADVGADEFRPPSDAMPPVTLATFAGTPGLDGWYVSPVTVTLAATDEGGSGVATVEYAFDGLAWLPYTGPFEIAVEGSSTVWYRSTDGAGNTEAPKAASVRVDLTPPEISVSTPTGGAAFVLRQPVAADWTASDAVSGLASAHGTAPSGAAIDTATVGTKAFLVSATDVAGLAASQAASYDVRYLFGGVLPPLDSAGTSTARAGAPLVVKFQLLDWGLAAVPTAVAHLFVAPVAGGVPGPEVPAVPMGGANTGNLFRYDPALAHYVFNMGTRGMAAGPYRLRISLDDGTSELVDVALTTR